VTDTERAQLSALAQRLNALLNPDVDLMHSLARGRLWDVLHDLQQMAATTTQAHLWFLGCGTYTDFLGTHYNKIGAIKAVRALTGIGLSEAKNLVESAPQDLGPVNADHEAVRDLLANHVVEWRKP
jgi:hypothetical protein